MSREDDNNRIIVKGSWGSIEYAVRSNGTMPAKKALDLIEKKDKQSWRRIHALLAMFANKGGIKNKSQFKQLQVPIFELKRHPHRIACFFEGNKCLLLTHIFDKKSNSSKKYVSKEIDKAIQIMKEHLDK